MLRGLYSCLVAVAAIPPLLFATTGLAGAPGQTFQTIVSADGVITAPKTDYRREWVMIGVWSLAGHEGGVEGLHIVYTQPEAVRAFRSDGQFPDGAVIVKELWSTLTDNYTTGAASTASEMVGRFVMVKDRKNRFPASKVWGRNWGWAYFDGVDAAHSDTDDYNSECLGCHIPARNTDWIYVEAYPVLTE